MRRLLEATFFATRRIAMSNGRMCLYVVQEKPADVDGRMRAWLTESYATSST